MTTSGMENDLCNFCGLSHNAWSVDCKYPHNHGWDDTGHRNMAPPLVHHTGEHKPPIGPDMVLLPKHYSKYKIEPVYFLGENRVNGFQWNIVKYAMRAEDKHGDKGQEDLKKVIRYTMMYAKFLLGDPDWANNYKTAFHSLMEEELSYGD